MKHLIKEFTTAFKELDRDQRDAVCVYAVTIVVVLVLLVVGA